MMIDYALNQSLNGFVSNCNSVLQSLSAARSTEGLDAATDDRTWLGMGISCLSGFQNYDAAAQVDGLRQEAERINSMLRQRGCGIYPISTCFAGETIRSAENNQHNFAWNFLSGGKYSTYGSFNVMSKISGTMAQIEHAKQQAIQIQNQLPAYPFSGRMPAHCRNNFPYSAW